MRTGELLQQIDAEIRDTTRRLTFWREQMRHQAGSDLASHVRAIVDGHEAQLGRLREARNVFDESPLLGAQVGRL